MENELLKIKRMQKQLAACFALLLFIIIALLSIYDLSPGKEALALTGNYNIASNGRLTADNWNNLDNDFVAQDNARIGGNSDGANWELGVTGNIIQRNGNTILGADNSGNVGINAANPLEKLQVAGNIKLGGTEGDIKDVNAIVGNNDLFLRSNFGETAPVYIGGSQISFYTGGTQKLSIAPNGDLQVLGDLNINGALNPKTTINTTTLDGSSTTNLGSHTFCFLSKVYISSRGQCRVDYDSASKLWSLVNEEGGGNADCKASCVDFK